jgi:micrococcal nuclease
MRRRRGFVVPAVVLALAGCGGPAATPAATRQPSAVRAPDRAFTATVDRVVDGDTFIALRRGEHVRVRLIGVDAPESVRPGHPVECWGHEASAVLTRLLPAGTRVRAAYQAGGRTDVYGRDLWDVWLPDGRLVQAVLVRRGAAEAVAYRPQVAHAAYLERVEASARDRGAGLWGRCAP